jgi:hypothetical protein
MGNGGAERDRTAGLLVANEALSQLSYSPTLSDTYILAAILGFRNLPAPGICPAYGRSFAACRRVPGSNLCRFATYQIRGRGARFPSTRVAVPGAAKPHRIGERL